MAFDFKWLGHGQVTATAGVILTNPTNKISLLRSMSFYNSNSTAEVIELYKVKNAAGAVGTAAVENQIFKLTIEPYETAVIEITSPGMVFDAVNDTLQAKTTTASVVTYILDGAQK